MPLKACDQNIRIYGENVYLRPITVFDTDMVLEWRNCERTVKNFFYRKPITRDEHLQWLEGKVFKGLVHQFVVCVRETDEPVGVVYLQHYDEEKNLMESGVFFGLNAPSGKGMGTEAVKLLVYEYGFKVLGLKKMYARVLATNIASRKLHEKAGFVQTMYEKNAMEIDGGQIDIVTYEVEQ